MVHPPAKRRAPTELDHNERVQAVTMRYLLEHGRVATPAQLIEFFGFSHARLTKILGDLEASGYIRRERDTQDRRRVIVYLTDAGYRHAAATWESLVGRMTAVLEALGEEDTAHFLRIARKLTALDMAPPPPIL